MVRVKERAQAVTATSIGRGDTGAVAGVTDWVSGFDGDGIIAREGRRDGGGLGGGGRFSGGFCHSKEGFFFRGLTTCEIGGDVVGAEGGLAGFGGARGRDYYDGCMLIDIFDKTEEGFFSFAKYFSSGNFFAADGFDQLDMVSATALSHSGEARLPLRHQCEQWLRNHHGKVRMDAR